MEYNAVGGDEIIVTNPYAVGPAQACPWKKRTATIPAMRLPRTQKPVQLQR